MDTEVGDPLMTLVVDDEKAELIRENRSLKASNARLRGEIKKLHKHVEQLEKGRAPRGKRCGTRIRMPDDQRGRQVWLSCVLDPEHKGLHMDAEGGTWGTPR